MDFLFNLCHMINRPDWAVFFAPSLESTKKQIVELQHARRELPILGEIITTSGVFPYQNPNHNKEQR